MSAGLRDIAPKVIKTQAVEVEAAGEENEIGIAAVTGKKIVVVNFFLVASASVYICFRSNTTDLTGEMILAVKGTYNPGYNPDGHFQTAAGEILNIGFGGAGKASGWINYYEE